jgi:histidine triad (HIT) family protein
MQQDIIYRDETTTAWVNVRWWENNPGAAVVVPNVHVEHIFELERELAGDIHETARRIALAMKAAYECPGISTRQHNGPHGQQEVWHYHLHVFPRFDGDGLYGAKARLTTPEERLPYADALRAALSLG